MKCLRGIMFLLFAGFIFSSCQKEITVDTNDAQGSLKKNASNECMPILVSGRYQKDTVLKTSNYVDIQVDVTSAGLYMIKTDTINGYSFSASGPITTAGIYTIRLVASGKPIAAGADVFRIKFDTSVCEVNIIVTTGSAGPGGTAVYSLNASPTGTCSGATVNGTYMQGLATNGSNTANVNVNVAQAGTYFITTGAPKNGVTFSATGTFSGTGMQSITLTASGTPAAAGSFTYPLSAGPSNCNFSVTYAAAGPPATYTIDCTGAVDSGTFQAGTPTTSAEKVTINATSTNIGSYSVTTNTVNGVSFSGGGSFPAAGTMPVDLYASGTPTAAGVFTYTATAATGGSNCTFSVTFLPGAATGTITANIDGVPRTFNMGILVNNSGTSINLGGDNNATGNEFMYMSVDDSPNPIVINMPYNVNSTNTIVAGAYSSSSSIVYESTNDGTTQPTPFTVTFTTITPTKLIGTFSGRLLDNAGAGPGIKMVTNGMFNINY